MKKQKELKITTEETSTPVEVGPNKEICLKWEEVQPKKEALGYEFGSKNKTKMLLFIKQNNFTRQDYLYFYNLPVARLDDETYEYYVIRRKFCNALQKYKHEIQSMIMMNAMEKFMKEQKDKKEAEEKSAAELGKEIQVNI